MSLALIQESAREVRRLAIAGSPLAIGDFRLKKLLAPLEQAGAKAPVFTQVAKAITDLVNGKESDSAANLLALSTLLNAILYTQGQSSADGSFLELEAFGATCACTKTPARALKPLVQALTSSGGGRFEVIKLACERGAFNDLRLIDPAIQALGDNYSELADLIAEKILPAYGPGIVPRLKAGLDLKGKKQDGRRLQLMHQLDAAGTIELCKNALEDGSPEVKAAAISCLGKHEDCLPLVFEQTNAKNKMLRAAALEALAELDRPEVTTLFTELIKGKVLDILARPFRALRNRQVLNSLLEEGKRVFGLLLKGEPQLIQRYSEILDCLVERKDAETEAFLLDCFNQCDKLAKVKTAKNFPIAGGDLIARLTELLSRGSAKALEAILAKRDVVPPLAFGHVFESAVRTWPAEKVYEEFSPLLSQKKGVGQERNQALQSAIFACRPPISPGFPDLEVDESDANRLGKMPWDPRWLDAAIKADLRDLVCLLARPGHKPAVEYLLKRIDLKEPAQAGQTIAALCVCQYPKVTDVFLDLLAKSTKGARASYQVLFLFQNARHLPPADLPRLDTFAASLDEQYVDRFLEAIAPLRAVKPAN